MDNIITIALHAFLRGAIFGKAVASDDILKELVGYLWIIVWVIRIISYKHSGL